MQQPMRIRALRAALVLAPIALAACSDDPIGTPDTADAVRSSMVKQIAAMGFREDRIVDEGDYFRVEGDVIIYKRDLAGPRLNRSPDGPRRQWYTSSLVTQSKMASGIRVNLNGISGNSAWLSAARSALSAAGSTYHSKIRFVENATSADITFSFGSLPSGVIAQANFPASGGPGATVTITTASTSLSSSQKIWVMVHELGHTIGYRHADWQANGESSSPLGATQVPNTPSSDNGSVMRAIAGPSWNGFNSNDHATNAYVYPAPAVALTSDGLDANNSAHFTWTAISNVSGYQVHKNEWLYEWNYEPSFPGGGYYAWNVYTYYVGTVTTNSFTSSESHDPAHCYPDRYVIYTFKSIYPSGRVGPETESQTQYC
jgi:Dual-action HEIGH metallo-peptidase